VTRRGASIVVGLAVAASAGAQAPEEPRAAEAPPVFRAGTDRVVLDVVVRDKKGRTVRDLRADEIEVYEDGVRQTVESFSLQAAGDEREEPEPAPATASAGTPSAAPATPAKDPRHVNLVTLVFDQLGVDGRRLARQAGEQLLSLVDRPDLYISIFDVRESLHLVQQFTTDREQLREAVREATGKVNTQYTGGTGELERASREFERAQERLASAQASGAAAGSLAQLGREVDMQRMAMDALRLTDTLQREQQGHSSLFAILALAKQQQRLAGRKTILFFAEGLQVPNSLDHVLANAISQANRANVSVYAVDARGLTDVPTLEASRETLARAARAGQAEMMTRGVGPVSKEQILVAETAQSALRMDGQGALRDLAEGTGGVLIANRNDVRKGIEKAIGDLRGYYELAYEPTRKEYDGRFRRIALRVSRPGVTVQARSGYFAVPPDEGAANFAYEVELLRTLRAVPAPEDIPIRTSAFRFGPEVDGVRYTAVTEIPLASIAFEADGSGETDRVHFSAMTVVRDVTGAVVEKFSEDSPVFLPRQKRDELQLGNVVFSRSFRLAPGRYTLEIAVVDQLGHKRGVRRSELQVAPAPRTVSLSDLTIVRRTEPVPQGVLASDDPFRVGANRIVPFLSEPRVDPKEDLAVYLVAYPRAEESRRDLLVELVRDKALVTQSLLELPAPDAHGRVPYLARLPAQDLPPGHYDVRVLFKQGGATAQGKVSFTVGEP
jgi:VWFA-related protein